MELYILCTLFLLLNSGLTVQASRRSWTTDGKRYFSNVSFVFKNTLVGLNSCCVDRGRTLMALDVSGGTEGLGQGRSEL